MSFPVVRPRRLRVSAPMRRLVAETRIHPAQLVLPMFVREGLDEPKPITSMPGVVQHSRDSLRKAAVEAVQAGVGGLMLFGVPTHKDEVGSGGCDPDGILNAALRDVVSEVGDATVGATVTAAAGPRSGHAAPFPGASSQPRAGGGNAHRFMPVGGRPQRRRWMQADGSRVSRTGGQPIRRTAAAQNVAAPISSCRRRRQ